MKIAVCLIVVILVVSIEAFSLRSARSKRGFRTGAADRFSHGFGKRTDEVEGGAKVNYDQFVAMMQQPGIAERVASFLDKDNNGLISLDEIME